MTHLQTQSRLYSSRIIDKKAPFKKNRLQNAKHIYIYIFGISSKNDNSEENKTSCV